MVVTRSQSKIRQQLSTNIGDVDVVDIDVNIDFDEAIIEWRKNKNVLKNGMFSYKKNKQNCCHIYNNPKEKCRKKQIINSLYCEYHYQ